MVRQNFDGISVKWITLESLPRSGMAVGGGWYNLCLSTFPSSSCHHTHCLLEFFYGLHFETSGICTSNRERAINPIALRSLAVRTGNSKTLEEFVDEL